MIHHKQHGQRCDKADERPFHGIPSLLFGLLHVSRIIAARFAALLMLAAHSSLAFALPD